jgi:hypothetical protein
MAKPGRRYCEFHGQRYRSKDEVKRANQDANLKYRHTQPKPKQPDLTPGAMEGRAREIGEMLNPVLRDSDGLVLRAHVGAVNRLAGAELRLEPLEALASPTVRQERLIDKLTARRDRYMDDLGLTPASRARLAPWAAQQEQAKVRRVMGGSLRSAQQ